METTTGSAMRVDKRPVGGRAVVIGGWDAARLCTGITPALRPQLAPTFNPLDVGHARTP